MTDTNVDDDDHEKNLLQDIEIWINEVNIRISTNKPLQKNFFKRLKTQYNKHDINLNKLIVNRAQSNKTNEQSLLIREKLNLISKKIDDMELQLKTKLNDTTAKYACGVPDVSVFYYTDTCTDEYQEKLKTNFETGTCLLINSDRILIRVDCINTHLEDLVKDFKAFANYLDLPALKRFWKGKIKHLCENQDLPRANAGRHTKASKEQFVNTVSSRLLYINQDANANDIRRLGLYIKFQIKILMDLPSR
eukprot:Pgem_evm1s20120